jgi:hypothetical protein
MRKNRSGHRKQIEVLRLLTVRMKQAREQTLLKLTASAIGRGLKGDAGEYEAS